MSQLLVLIFVICCVHKTLKKEGFKKVLYTVFGAEIEGKLWWQVINLRVFYGENVIKQSKILIVFSKYTLYFKVQA